MSNTVDNRIVELGFDNSKFERGVSKSLETLQKLNNVLNKTNSSKGLSDLAGSVKGFDASPMVNAVQQISDKFTTLGIIGVTALENITNRAVNAGISLAKSLSIDQVTEGWKKYGDKTTAVATIINNAKKELDGQAYSIEEVSDQLDKLNWFTDETSYNFVDMVSNIGKFTSQGQSLEKANTAMQGIATWAAVSGQNAASASRAMYNMSQALGVGAVKLMDWKSIENANMATQEFKQTAIETAVKLGTLTEKEGKYFSTSKKTEVTVENFSQTLQDAWFNSDVLMATLEKYGGFGTRLAEVTEELDVSATDFLKGITEFQNGSESEGYLNWLSELGLTSNEITPYMEELTSAEYELGLKAFRAAQEARTFRDAIDAIKDGVSTSWMNLFETLFGNYEESKKLWTSFANEGYEIFAEPINKLGEFLGRLKDTGRIQYIIDGFKNIANFARSLVLPIKMAFLDVFPNGLSLTTSKLGPILLKFRQFTERLRLSVSEGSNIIKFFKGFFSVIKKFGEAIKKVVEYLKPLFSSFRKLGDALLDVAGKFGDWLSKITESETDTSFFQKIVEGIANAISSISNLITNFKISDIFSNIVNFIKEKFIELKDTFSNYKDVFGNFDLGKIISTGIKTGIGVVLIKFINSLSEKSESFGDILDKVRDNISGFLKGISEMIKGLADAKLKNIATSLLLFAISLALLSSIKTEKLKTGLIGLFSMFAIMLGFIAALGGILLTFKMSTVRKIKKVSTAMILISAAMLILSLAMIVLAGAVAAFALVTKLDWQSGLTAMAIALIEVGAALALLSLIGPKIIFGALALLVVSAAMIVLAGAVAAFSLVTKLDWQSGLIAMAIALIEVGAALALLSLIGPKIIFGALALLVVSAAMIVLAGAVAAFALVTKLDWQSGLTAMAIALIEVGGALALLSLLGPSILLSAVAIAVVSVALIALSASLLMLSAINPDKLGPTLLSLAVALGAIVIAIALVSSMGGMAIVAAAAILIVSVALVAGAAAFLIFAVAANILVPALQSMSEIGFGTIAIGLIEFAGAMIVLSIAGAIAGAVSPLLILFAIAIGLLGPALLMFIPSVMALQGMDLAKIALGLAEMAGALGLFDVALAILTPLSPVLALAASSFKKIGDAGLNAGTGVKLFSDSLQAISDSGSTIIGIAPKITKSVGNMMTDLASSLSGTKDSFETIGTDLGAGFYEGFNTKTSEIVSSVTSNLTTAVSAIRSKFSNFYNAGVYIGSGLVLGLNSKYNDVVTAAESLGNAAVNALNAAAEVASPSKASYRTGRFIGMGEVNGLRSMLSAVYLAGRELGDESINGVSDAISKISSALDTEIDINPTITPVLDLSNIQNGAKDLNSMLNGKSISLSGTVTRARQAYTSNEPNTTSKPVETPSGVTNNFVQNNYSPKALSRTDIYRQTKNLLYSR